MPTDGSARAYNDWSCVGDKFLLRDLFFRRNTATFSAPKPNSQDTPVPRRAASAPLPSPVRASVGSSSDSHTSILYARGLRPTVIPTGIMKREIGSDEGFTLLEILVALVIIGLLVGTLVPATLSQVSRGEHNRIGEDLHSLETAAKLFRVDVQRWPGDMEDLVTQPTSGDSVATGGTYPTPLLSRWAGPYLEEGTIKGDTLPTALGGVIVNRFSQTAWGGKNFLTMKVKFVQQADAQAVSVRVDGDSDVTSTDAGGQVRWLAGDTLVFLAVPVQ